MLIRRLEQKKSLEDLENAERAALTIRQRYKIPTEEEKVRAREKQRQLERDETSEDDSSFPDLPSEEWKEHFTIWVAARVGSLQGVTRLLAAAGANSQLINQKDANGFTPVYYSLLAGHIRVTKFLLDKGALWDFRYVCLSCTDSDSRLLLTLPLVMGDALQLLPVNHQTFTEKFAENTIRATTRIGRQPITTAERRRRSGRPITHTYPIFSLSLRSVFLISLLSVPLFFPVRVRKFRFVYTDSKEECNFSSRQEEAIRHMILIQH